MSTVEIETGTYIKRYAFWNPATWSIPKLYWDAWSQEQRLHAICRQLEKVIAYADYLGVNTDDIAARLKAIEEGQLDPIIETAIEAWFEENEPEIVQDISNLESAVTALQDADTAITANGWVTTERIADEAVTAEKISTAFKEEIASEIESATSSVYEKLKYLTSKDFKVVNRFIVGSSVHSTAPFYGYGATQGSCVFSSNGVDYWLCATNPDNNNWVIIVNMATNEVVYTGRFPLGHANGCSFDGDHTVVFANNTNNAIVYLDVSDPLAPFVRNTVLTPGGETIICACYVGDTGKVMLVHGQLSIYNFNVTGGTIYTDETLSVVDSDISFRYNSNQFSGWQSVTCDGNYIYIAHSGPECIVTLDMTGEVYAIINLDRNIGFIQVDEIECAFMVGNKLYLSVFEWLTASLEPERTDETRIHLSSLTLVDLSTNEISNRISPNFTWGSNSEVAGFYLYDPFAQFEDDRTGYHQKLLNPSRYGCLFMDDVFSILESMRFYAGQVTVMLETDYTLNMYIGSREMIINPQNHEIAAFMAVFSNVSLSGGTVSGIWPRSDSLKYSLIAVNSTLHIGSGVTFPEGNTYDVQGNSSVIIGAKAAGTFTIQQYAGTIVSPAYE